MSTRAIRIEKQLEGGGARAALAPRDANPYRTGTIRHLEWDAGWVIEDAKRCAAIRAATGLIA